MTKSVGYIRVSTDKQDFERQRDEITEYAQKNGFFITKFFEDKHTGSDYKDRKGFQELLQYLEDIPDIKVIIFDEISRMGRDTAEQVMTYKRLSQKGIRIYTRGKGEFGKNKEDTLLFTVLSAIAEYEKQTIIDRCSSGRRRVVREGATQISTKPYGYNLLLTQKKDRVVVKRQFLEINEEEAKVIREIFRIVDDGGTTFDVIRYLKAHSIRSPEGNSVWARSTTTKILHNTIYCGKWQFGKFYKNRKTRYSLSRRPDSETIIVNVPAIISKEFFDRVQTKIKNIRKKFNPKNLKDVYLLKGIGVCGCGRALQCYMDHVRIYRCPQRNIIGVSEKTCPIHSLKSDFVEKILITELKSKVSNPEFFKDVKLKEIQTKQNRMNSLQNRIEKLGNEIEEGKTLAKAYYEKSAKFEIQNHEKSKIFENLADTKLQEIEAQTQEIKNLQTESDKIKENAVDASVLDDIKNALQWISVKEAEKLGESDLQERQAFFRKYVKEVRVSMLRDETEALRKSIGKLRRQKIFAKGNKDIKRLYMTCFTREHTSKSQPMQVLQFHVEFVGNLSVDIKFPYFHDNPEMAMSYERDGKVRLLEMKRRRNSFCAKQVE